MSDEISSAIINGVCIILAVAIGAVGHNMYTKRNVNKGQIQNGYNNQQVHDQIGNVSGDGININQNITGGSGADKIVINKGLTIEEAMKFSHQLYPKLKEEVIAELRNDLREILKDTKEEKIVPPSMRIIVPALQNISITEEKSIRKIYARLIAASMNSVVKAGVHPGFIEIIKQLSPDEAKVLEYIARSNKLPIVSVRYENEQGNGFEVLRNFSNIGELAKCEYPLKIDSYFDNLVRLGLIEMAPLMASLTNKQLYEPLKKHPYVMGFTNVNMSQDVAYNNVKIVESYVDITRYGKEFCDICIFDNNEVVVRMGK